jgi:hypothetical protein
MHEYVRSSGCVVLCSVEKRIVHVCVSLQFMIMIFGKYEEGYSVQGSFSVGTAGIRLYIKYFCLCTCTLFYCCFLFCKFTNLLFIVLLQRGVPVQTCTQVTCNTHSRRRLV